MRQGGDKGEMHQKILKLRPAVLYISPKTDSLLSFDICFRPISRTTGETNNMDRYSVVFPVTGSKSRQSDLKILRHKQGNFGKNAVVDQSKHIPADLSCLDGGMWLP